jgi:hypothetical protein
VVAGAWLGTAALAATGCGGSAGDLLALEVSGGLAGDTVRLRVTEDGRASCDGGPLRQISSAALIEAREVERGLAELAEDGDSFESAAGADRRTYLARTRAGTVSWTEGEPDLPPVLPQAAALAERLRQDVCAEPAGAQLRTLPFERARSLARST